jgi:ribonuclease BN (tRNA processing enzyme)
MIIRVLGCSGAIAEDCRTTAFLVDDDILIDAGTGVGDLSLAELARVDHIFISHSHLDHVLSIGLLADTVMRARKSLRKGPVTVHALAETIDALRKHIFNGVIWPDFTRLPSAESPVLAFSPVVLGQVVELNQRKIEVLSAVHTVPAVGFAVQAPHEGSGWWVYTGDTGPNAALWLRLKTMVVDHLVIETAFSDAERQLARISRHLSPSSLSHELAQLSGNVNIYITHIKPGEMQAVMGQIAELRTPHRLQALVRGQTMRLLKSV